MDINYINKRSLTSRYLINFKEYKEVWRSKVRITGLEKGAGYSITMYIFLQLYFTF